MRRLVVVATTLALCLVSAAPAAASSEGHGYLALGDSVAFGTNPLLNPANASNFTGYPEIVADTLDIEDVNASCPGEATGGFISSTGLDNVCRPYRALFPLHVEYTGTQLAFAVDYLKNNPRTRLVTIDLGANDLFRLQKNCASDPNPATCVGTDLPAFLANMEANLRTIFAALRGTGYTGLIVALTYYALDYNDAASTIALNNPMIDAASHYGVLVASGFDAFKPLAIEAGGSSCNAGLLIRLSLTSCDVHPTSLGRDLLAAAIVKTIAASCPGGVEGCLDRNRG